MKKDGQDEIHDEIIPFFLEVSALDLLALESLPLLPPADFLFPEYLDEDPRLLSDLLGEEDLEQDRFFRESDLESFFL